MTILYVRLRGWGWQQLWETSCCGSHIANYCGFRNYWCLNKIVECCKMNGCYKMKEIFKIKKLYKVVWPWLTLTVQWTSLQITIINLPLACVTHVFFIYGHTMAQLVLPPPDIIGCTKGIILRLCLRRQDEDRGNFPLVPVYLEHAHGGGGEDWQETHHETVYLHNLQLRQSRQVIQEH